MNASSAGRNARFWRATLRWVLLGLLMVALVYVGAYGLGLFGSDRGAQAVLNVVAALPGHLALLLALAGFAGGFSVGKARPKPEGSFRISLIGAALITYGLTAFISPLASYVLLPDGGLPGGPSRYPMGPELPWTLWHLRAVAVEQGLGGGGPITPLVRSHLYGFSLYFPFLVTALGASTAWAGLVVGNQVARVTKPVVSRSVAWFVWLVQAGGFYLGTKIALELILYAGWTPEQAVILPLLGPVVVPALLALTASVESGRLGRAGRPGRPSPSNG